MKLEKDLKLSLELTAELVSCIKSKKPIRNSDDEELGTRYYAQVDNAVVEMDIFDGETVMDKIGHELYVDRKAKDGTRIWRLRRPVDVHNDENFSDLFAALEAARRSEAAQRGAATRRARQAQNA